ncbi:MAG: sigma-70 family RNA polymerase sigma factor [Deltaproteobacteria bacterium]|nr:sigma-70 family RNA polymerase sigma factor [Deltaproteobacteria bacterium]
MTEPEDDDPETAYRRATQVYGADAVHDAILQRGVEVLERGVPYLLWAAHRARLDAHRRAQRRERLAPTEPEDAHAPPASSILDPFHQCMVNDSVRRVVDALLTLPQSDALALWWHLEGHEDQAILDRLKALDLNLSPDALRMRRERSLTTLRGMLKDDA